MRGSRLSFAKKERDDLDVVRSDTSASFDSVYSLFLFFGCGLLDNVILTDRVSTRTTQTIAMGEVVGAGAGGGAGTGADSAGSAMVRN